MCHYSPKEADRMRRGDFAFFAAISVPDAAKYTLRTVTDWLNWVCYFLSLSSKFEMGFNRHNPGNYAYIHNRSLFSMIVGGPSIDALAYENNGLTFNRTRRRTSRTEEQVRRGDSIH